MRGELRDLTQKRYVAEQHQVLQDIPLGPREEPEAVPEHLSSRSQRVSPHVRRICLPY